jgi:hypothetical protein
MKYSPSASRRISKITEQRRPPFQPIARYCRGSSFLVDKVRLVEDLLRFFQTDAVLPLDGPALCAIELESAFPYNSYIIHGRLNQPFAAITRS